MNIEKLLGEGGELMKVPHSHGSMCVYINEEMAARECTRCAVMRPITEYARDASSKTGTRGVCKGCVSTAFRKYYVENREHLVKKSREYVDKYPERVKETRDKYNLKSKTESRQRYNNWRIENKPRRAMSEKLRNARKRALPNTLTEPQLLAIKRTFKDACALTGDSRNIHMDHVIPVNTGHGGRVYGNIIPLSNFLNMSKKDNNIFEWFELNKIKHSLTQERFDILIKELAVMNNMSIVGYREYVYRCHANPRDLLINEEENSYAK